MSNFAENGDKLRPIGIYQTQGRGGPKLGILSKCIEKIDGNYKILENFHQLCRSPKQTAKFQ